MTVTTAVVLLPRRVASWASRRALARNSLTGIELGCSLCAAVWFSAGTSLTALAGGAALGGGYLTRRVGRQLGVSAFDSWLASICALAGELATFAGLAVGAGHGLGGAWPLAVGPASGPGGEWKLATGAAVLLGLRKVVRVCRPAPAPAGGSAADADDPAPRGPGALVSQLIALPAGERAIVITGTAVLYGARFTLLVMAGWGAVALAWSMIAGPRAGRRAAGPGVTAAACRDDGPIARFAGSVVHGQLAPLPPALAGLTATALLAGLGLGDLAGPVLLTPVAAMLLAAPGSAHPHTGRLDWLTPAFIQAGQYIYLAALGFAAHVPGPVTFALAGLVALRQLDVAARARQPLAGPGPRGLGWEGRMLAAGVGAMFGIATFSYLVLAAYLGWQLGSSALDSWFAAYHGSRPGTPSLVGRPAS
jgi:Family of unknown function (DUF5941)